MEGDWSPGQPVREFLKELHVASPVIKKLREDSGANTVGDIAECLDEKDLYAAGMKKVQVKRVSRRLKLSSGEAADVTPSQKSDTAISSVGSSGSGIPSLSALTPDANESPLSAQAEEAASLADETKFAPQLHLERWCRKLKHKKQTPLAPLLFKPAAVIIGACGFTSVHGHLNDPNHTSTFSNRCNLHECACCSGHTSCQYYANTQIRVNCNQLFNG
jgi:hypothetical protein